MKKHRLHLLVLPTGLLALVLLSAQSFAGNPTYALAFKNNLGVPMSVVASRSKGCIALKGGRASQEVKAGSMSGTYNVWWKNDCYNDHVPESGIYFSVSYLDSDGNPVTFLPYFYILGYPHWGEFGLTPNTPRINMSSDGKQYIITVSKK